MPPRRVDLTAPDRLICCDWGDSKTGKTDFALSFPPPIHFFNFDYGVDPLLKGPRYRGKDVLVYDYGVENPDDSREVTETLRRFHEEYLAAIPEADADGGTVIIDTAAALWELVRTVKLGEATRARAAKYGKDSVRESRLDYGPLNHYMAGLTSRVLHFPRVNAAFLNNCQSKYTEQGQELAEKKLSGWARLTAITDITLQHRKEHDALEGCQMFKVLVERCRHNTELEGVWISGPTYDLVFSLVFGER